MNNIKNDKKAFNLRIGTLGEDLGCRFLKEKGFSILERNYTKKWGEIDIIVQRNHVLHFIEVKSVSCEIKDGGVIRETCRQPEDAIHPWKIKRLQRAIQSYLLEKNLSDSAEWQFDVLGIFIDYDKKISKIRFTENVLI